MNNNHTRYQFPSYSMCEYKDMEDNLTQMEAKGWKIDRIGGFIWKFKKAESRNRRFFVAYPGEIERCNEKGWTKEIQWNELQIFSAEAETAPMDIQEATRVDNACAAMEKAFIPNLRIGLLLLVGYILTELFKTFNHSQANGVQPGWTFLCAACAAMICGVRLLNYSLWEKTSRQSIRQGKNTGSTKRSRYIVNILQIVFLILFVGAMVQFIW